VKNGPVSAPDQGKSRHGESDLPISTYATVDFHHSNGQAGNVMECRNMLFVGYPPVIEHMDNGQFIDDLPI
jgi:hypothetical protein